MFKNKDIDLGYKVYIPNLSDNSITVIPARDSATTDTIQLDGPPQFIIKDPNRDLVYALLSGTNKIQTIIPTEDVLDDTFTFEVGSSVAQENFVMIFSLDGSSAYVATNYEPSGVAVMNVSERTMTTGINVKSTTVNDFFFSPDYGRLYCVDRAMGNIYVINTSSNALIQTINIPESYTYVLLMPASGSFLLSGEGTGGDLFEYDPVNDVITRRLENVTDNIVNLTFSSDQKKVLVLGSDELVTVNIEDDFEIDERIYLDYKSPSDLQFLPDRKYILIPSTAGDLLMLMNPENYDTEDIISTGAYPGEMVIMESYDDEEDDTDDDDYDDEGDES